MLGFASCFQGPRRRAGAKVAILPRPPPEVHPGAEERGSTARPGASPVGTAGLSSLVALLRLPFPTTGTSPASAGVLRGVR